MVKNMFFFSYINSIGGIETFFYNVAQKYKDWDIAVYYLKGDQAQIERLSKFIRVRQYKGEIIKCERAFFNFSIDIIDKVEAKEYYLILHADYKAQGLKPPTHPKITKYLGVSRNTCDTFKELTGKTAELAYNPLVIEKPKRVLHLISATRLTPEKGKNRMIRFAKELDKAEIPYVWTIYTNDVNAIENDNIIYQKPRLDIIPYIADADYLVQLSDTEGYSYSMLEALSVGTPVIVTDFPVAKEMGVVNGKTGFILPMNMSEIPIEAIYKGVPKFKYTPKPDRWADILAKGESQYQKDLRSNVEVVCIKEYIDLVLDKRMKVNDVYTVSFIRAEALENAEVAKIKERR